MSIEAIKTKLKIITMTGLLAFYGIAFLLYKYPGRDYITYGEVSFIDILSSTVNFMDIVIPVIVTFTGNLPEKVNRGLTYLVEGPSCGNIPPSILNCEVESQWMNGANGFIKDDWVLYTSRNGYSVGNNDKAICGDKGEWLQLPKCIPLSFIKQPPYDDKAILKNLDKAGGATGESVQKVPAVSYLHGDNTVFEISTQHRKSIRDVKIGDQIQAMDQTKYSVILTYVTSAEYLSEEQYTFYSFQLKTGHILHGLTKDQCVHVLSNEATDNNNILRDTFGNIDKVAAKNLKVGHVVLVAFDNHIAQPSLGEVVSVKSFKDKGVYSIKTKHYNLFVNGINVPTDW